MRSAVIEVCGLRVELDERPVLHGIDLRVVEGEVVTLLGANGSGKSTLVRAAVGLVPATAGEVFLFGSPLRRQRRAVADHSEKQSFRDWWRIGYVPQRTTAAAGVPATVREVVSAGRLARRSLFRLSSRADREAVEQAIELVGLSDHAGRSVSSLSGGQQQRVLIARAASSEPDLLVLDEPNAGVDQQSQEAFARALRTFVASGRTVLLVLHEMGPLAPLLDRGVVLDSGRVVHDGPLHTPSMTLTGQPDHHDDHREDHQAGLFG